MTTHPTQMQDEALPDAYPDAETTTWTPKIMLGISTLRRMSAEARRNAEQKSTHRPGSERPS